jgi:capsular exopolysaccharide synthesis family protein
MERIKKALEKARNSQQGTSSSYATPVVASGEIKYTQTRTLDIPLESLRENRIITGYDASIENDAYKILRTRVLQRLEANNSNVLAITSPAPGAGKTVTAINLALSMSLELSRTVLLVDADLRHPKVHHYFNQPQMRGLSEYLQDDIPLEDLLVHPGLGQCIFLPGGQPLINSSEMLSSPKMAALVDELKARYPSRIVIFDLPPVLSGDDAIAFTRYTDATLLVLEDGVTQEEEVVRSTELLKDANLIGTVLNKSIDTGVHGYLGY